MGRPWPPFGASSAIGQIGPCLQLAPCYPADGTPEAAEAASAADTVENTLYLEPLLKGRYPRPGRADRRFVSGLDTAVKDGDLAVIATPVHFLGGQLLLARGCRRSGSAAPDSSRLFRRLATDLSPGHL